MPPRSRPNLFDSVGDLEPGDFGSSASSPGGGGADEDPAVVARRREEVAARARRKLEEAAARQKASAGGGSSASSSTASTPLGGRTRSRTEVRLTPLAGGGSPAGLDLGGGRGGGGFGARGSPAAGGGAGVGGGDAGGGGGGGGDGAHGAVSLTGGGIVGSVGRSTATELEVSLQQAMMDERAMKALGRAGAKEAIGSVSMALQTEKSGGGTMTQIEGQFSRLNVQLTDLADDDAVRREPEALYWVQLFGMHVRKHLQEIVALTDAGRETPAYYDDVMSKNQRLKDKIRALKREKADLLAEIAVLRQQRAQEFAAGARGGAGGGHGSAGSGGAVPDTRGIELHGLAEADEPMQELLGYLRAPPPPLIDTTGAEDILRRLDDAKGTLIALQAADDDMRAKLGGAPSSSSAASSSSATDASASLGAATTTGAAAAAAASGAAGGVGRERSLTPRSGMLAAAAELGSLVDELDPGA